MVRFIAIFIATLSVAIAAWAAEEPALLRSEGVPSSRGEALAFAPAMRLSGDVENVLGTDDAKGV